jgi:hypothetical protein
MGKPVVVAVVVVGSACAGWRALMFSRTREPMIEVTLQEKERKNKNALSMASL